MSRSILTLLLLFTTAGIAAQTGIFSKYAFEKKGYAVVGLAAGAKPNFLQQVLGEFYTDEISVLNDFKKNWVFIKKVPANTCGNHYSLQLTRYGMIVEDWMINLECKVITTDKGSFFFDPVKLERLTARLKKPIVRKDNFPGKTEGKHFIDSVKRVPGLLLVFQPFWTRFEGTFTFLYTPGAKESAAAAEKKLNALIKKKYPAQKFILFGMPGIRNGAYEFQLICDKNLFDAFKIYPKNNNWKEYTRELISVWKPAGQ
jgi:hypothetical protein